MKVAENLGFRENFCFHQNVKKKSLATNRVMREQSMEHMSPPLSQRLIGRAGEEDVEVQGVQLPNVEDIRKMEADLKRKSDLLSEVKILLKQAAERERAGLAERETLKAQIKTLLDINPKTPSEALAKELRQARLTIERLACEKKELQHQITSDVADNI